MRFSLLAALSLANNIDLTFVTGQMVRPDGVPVSVRPLETSRLTEQLVSCCNCAVQNSGIEES
jgi:hypothetical protein